MPFRKVSKWIEKLRNIPKRSEDQGSVAEEENPTQISSEILIGVLDPDKEARAQEARASEQPVPIEHRRRVTVREETSKTRRRSSLGRKSTARKSIRVQRYADSVDLQDAHFPTSAVHFSTQKSVARNPSDRLLTKSSIVKHTPISQRPEEEHLIAAPITDSEGRLVSNLELGEALTLLMRKGIIEKPVIPGSRDSAEYLKKPARVSTSSSEPSNAELVLPSVWRVKRPDQEYGYRPSVRPSKSEPIAKITLDQCVNTSLQDFRISYDDSLVRMKLKRYLDDDSCTQYFAMKSSIQLEPYIKEMRVREAEQRLLISKAMQSDILDDSDDIIVKQRGKMVLSKASVASGDEDKEYQMKVINLQTSEINTAFSDTVIISRKSVLPEGTENVRASMQVKLPCCQTCHPSPTGESQISSERSENTEESDMFSSPRQEIPSMFADLPLKGVNMTFGEGNTELYIIFEEIRPSSQLINLSISSYNITDDSKNFMFTWNFLKNSDSLYFSLDNVKEGNAKVLKTPRIYKFDMTPGIYLYFLKCPMAIELYNVSDRSETLIGKCNLKLNRCFADISNIYESTILLQNRDLCLCYAELQPMLFGKLVIRFRMRGNQAQFDKCQPAKVPFVDIPPLIETFETQENASELHRQSIHQISSRGNLVSEAELQAFRDGLNLVLVRNKALRTTQEEITQELKDRTNWMHEELKWKLTLQENAILSGKDPETIKWRQWKDDSTANVRYRPISHEEFLKDGIAHVEIEVLELLLYPESKPMLNDNLSHLYIELAFLDMSGKMMETLTMHKPVDEMQSVRFHFKRVFDIHMETHQSVLLAEMIRNNESIPFNLIAQPIEYRNELQSCYDIGVANLVLFDLLQSRQNTTVETIQMHDAYNKDVIIGMLKIRFVGVLAMRSMALHILTPQTFKIIR